MTTKIAQRVINIANHIISSKDTIRDTAIIFKVSKSTVHKDIQERLLEIDPNKYSIVKEIMQEHLKMRHINGGEATRQLFLRKKALTL